MSLESAPEGGESPPLRARVERHAGFVRAVMLGRDGLHRSVLLAAFLDAGAVQPRSYLTTGNVTFAAARSSIDTIRRSVEEQLEAVVGRRTEVAIRAISHLDGLVESDPVAPYQDAVEHEVSFLTAPIEPSSMDLPIESPRGHVTVVALTPTEVFAVGKEIAGRREGAGGFVERTLGQRVTTRSWRTVVRVVRSPD